MNGERLAGRLSDMDLERELRGALLMDASGHLPEELRAAVAAVRREPPAVGAGGRRRVAIFRAALAAAAAVAVVGAAVGAGWALRGAIVGPAATATPTPTVRPSVVSTPTPSPVPLVHAQKWSLSFDYPETWTLTDRNGQMGPLGFVGNGSSTTICATPTMGPDHWPPATRCTTTWNLAGRSIVVRFESVTSWRSSSPLTHWTSIEVITGRDLPGAERLTIDGLPARFAKSATNVVPYTGEAIPGATEVLWWGLPSSVAGMCSSCGSGWEIVAAIRGPDVAEMEAQAKAMVAGIHFVPHTVMLPTDPVALHEAGIKAMTTFFADDKANANDEHDHQYDCFPRDVGSQRATITQIPFGAGPLTKPLPVICTIESMEPNAMQGWTLVMSQSWEAGSDYPAGLVKWMVTLGPGGGMGGAADAILYPDLKTSTTPLYPHMGPSEYPG